MPTYMSFKEEMLMAMAVIAVLAGSSIGWFVSKSSFVRGIALGVVVCTTLFFTLVVSIGVPNRIYVLADGRHVTFATVTKAYLAMSTLVLAAMTSSFLGRIFDFFSSRRD